ncbi:PP2C family protein-serine/threonine phosphatase [Streptomyces sp. NBC_00893]|uniref:PP2C family protein-serine/threonine phosphatase n=1 Tax=Streptomyces sp. NBC_00893 TaxID=2975862 RepID=UPI002253EB36|nr:SpoIIE family protein phosphatase [Streptomyces sp. NBC_00893]MCX4847305.1 SpoIIE family protein phosphatase [Streptomyces sp. NBC_00893]
MKQPEIDYRAVFQALPGAVALLTPQLFFVDVNEEWLRVVNRSRERVIGHYMPDDYADRPNHPNATVARNIGESLRRVARTGEPETMELQRFDPADATARPRAAEARFWSMTNVPVPDADGRVALLLHRVEEVTELIQARAVALSLQEAMLPAPRAVGRHPVAVRYRPAVRALEVGGDWYDLVEMPGDRLGVAVGDVVGHGLSAASVMGQLRSALSAASHSCGGPARAMEILELYARSVVGAENTTVANVFIDWSTHRITYSSAGHLPPALLRSDGTVEFLDRATDPPLGARLDQGPWAQATVPFTEGSFLVLYTDGLIERRNEDIDTGLARLAASLTRHRGAEVEALADALLADLLPSAGLSDDTALVIVPL